MFATPEAPVFSLFAILRGFLANVGLRIRLNLYKRGFKIYDLLVNRAAMGRARFMFYPWFIFFFRVERPRPPLGRIKDSCESRNLRCLFAESF